jgi:hypothetical protein
MRHDFAAAYEKTDDFGFHWIQHRRLIHSRVSFFSFEKAIFIWEIMPASPDDSRKIAAQNAGGTFVQNDCVEIHESRIKSNTQMFFFRGLLWKLPKAIVRNVTRTDGGH